MHVGAIREEQARPRGTGGGRATVRRPQRAGSIARARCQPPDTCRVAALLIRNLTGGHHRGVGAIRDGRAAWLDFAASGANVPFELADRQGRFDDMMQMLGGGQDAENKMRDYLLFHMRMTRVWCGPWAIERHKPFMDVHGAAWVAAVDEL